MTIAPSSGSSRDETTPATGKDPVRLPCTVQRYHVHWFLWKAYMYVGNDFTTAHKKSNHHDKCAIAVFSGGCSKESNIVRHLPWEISKVCSLPFFVVGLFSGVVMGMM